ncbi:uncharacterized protein DEA37_0007133, partial [Paragonimus westermani]
PFLVVLYFFELHHTVSRPSERFVNKCATAHSHVPRMQLICRSMKSEYTNGVLFTSDLKIPAKLLEGPIKKSATLESYRRVDVYQPYLQLDASTFSSLKYFGINSGMMLMNLTELRRINWWFLWQKEVLKEINEIGYLPIADQQVINQIIRRNHALYHSLPCEWNIQVHLSSGMDCCPKRWIDRLPDEDDCFEQSQVDYSNNHHTLQQARLVHYNIRQKPETSGSSALSPLEWTTSMSNMSLLQLRHRFFRVYHKFRQIPLSCFT